MDTAETMDLSREWNVQKGPETKEKLQESPLDPDDDDEPLLKLPKHWIAGAHHTAYGKSPSTASKETTAGNVAAAAKNLCIILLLNCI